MEAGYGLLYFNNGVTSAGVAATEAMAHELRLAEGQPAWSRLLNLIPSLCGRNSRMQGLFSPLRVCRQLSFPQRDGFVGERWALLPSAGRLCRSPALDWAFPIDIAWRHPSGSDS